MYFIIVLISLAVGIMFSEHAIIIAPYVPVFLGAIFFLSALKIDITKVMRQLQSPKTLTLTTLLMLIGLPILVYYATSALYPTLALAFLILASMPTGMTAPLFAEISGGRQSLAIVLTVITSLLAPLTIPFVIKLMAGEGVAVGYLDMFISLAKIIFVPFILAHFTRKYAPRLITATSSVFTPLALIFLGLIVTGIISKQSDRILESLAQGESFIWLTGLFVLFLGFHIIGYFLTPWRDHRDRITITVCLTYMNFTLAVYLVDEFFTETEIIVPVVLSILPWTLMLIPFQMITKRK